MTQKDRIITSYAEQLFKFPGSIELYNEIYPEKPVVYYSVKGPEKGLTITHRQIGDDACVLTSCYLDELQAMVLKGLAGIVNASFTAETTPVGQVKRYYGIPVKFKQ